MIYKNRNTKCEHYIESRRLGGVLLLPKSCWSISVSESQHFYKRWK